MLLASNIAEGVRTAWFDHNEAHIPAPRSGCGNLTLFTFVGLCLLHFVIGLGVSQADWVSPPPGLIGWWRAENNGADSINTNVVFLSPGTTFTNGFVGAAFAFDGANDIAYVTASAFASVSNDFTMEMWVFPTANRGVVSETISAQTGIGTDQRYAVFPSHGDNSFGSGHAGAGISIGTNGITVFEQAAFYIASPLVFNTALSGWNHLAVVYTNNRPTLYLNGAFVRAGLAARASFTPARKWAAALLAISPVSSMNTAFTIARSPRLKFRLPSLRAVRASA